MFIDARKMLDKNVIETDLAIIGAGAAGITIAREFANKITEVCLIESGGLVADPETQALYEGQSTGTPYSLQGSRLRFFGGSTNHWGGYCLPLTALDFEKRDWVPYSGWPITREELIPYYKRAMPICQLGPFEFEDPSYWATQTNQKPLDLQTKRVETKIIQLSSSTKFGEEYRSDIEHANNIKTLLYANVVNIETNSSGKKIEILQAKTLQGNKFSIKAKFYILAAGGIENPRLLLASNSVHKNGLGNSNDLVGRFFADHPIVSDFLDGVVGSLEDLPSFYYKRKKLNGTSFQAYFSPSKIFLREKRLLDATLGIKKSSDYKINDQTYFYKSKRRLILEATRSFLKPPLNRESEILGSQIVVGCSCEQAPNPQSRVSLDNKKDILGMPRVKLNWKLSEKDRRSMYAHIHAFVTELSALGIGRAAIRIPNNGIWPHNIPFSSHHIGTTRMSATPSEGVVDGNCGVYGVNNLYIAGSSVFTTSGSNNPTLTIVALALRLADYLKTKL